MRRRTNYVWLNEYKLERGCAGCGYKRSGAALDMHHLRDKAFTISAKLHLSLDEIQREVEKCIVLCANCHRELHAGLLDPLTLKHTLTRE